MLRPRWVLGIAGHREGFDVTLVHASLHRVVEQLAARCDLHCGVIELYGGAALGCDLLAASVARQLSLAYHVILPLPEAEFKRDFAGHAKEWSKAAAFIADARAGVRGSTLRTVSASSSRPDCYFDAGFEVVRACDVLLAVWDGQPAAGIGGTADIVAQARAERVPVVWIDSRSGETRFEGLPASWPEPDGVIEEVNAWTRSTPGPEQHEDFEQLASDLDNLANRERSRFQPGLARAIGLHGLAALVAAAAATGAAIAASAGPGAVERAKIALSVLTGTELVMVVGALVIVLYLDRAGSHHRWLRARFAAELFRGLRCTRGLLDPLDAHVTRHAPEWRRLSVSAALLAQSGVPTEHWTALRDGYLKARLNDQIAHYESKWQSARSVRNWTRDIARYCTYGAPVFVLLSLFNKLNAWHWERGPGALVVTWMPIALPLVAGIAASLGIKLDSVRRTSRYAAMQERLATFRARIATLRTRSTVENTVRECEEILIDENLEWYLATSDVEAV